MGKGVEMVGLYVRDQDEAVAFYVDKLGFRVHTDVKNGDYRWLTVQHPDQPSFQLGLFKSSLFRKYVPNGGLLPYADLKAHPCRATARNRRWNRDFGPRNAVEHQLMWCDVYQTWTLQLKTRRNSPTKPSLW